MIKFCLRSSILIGFAVTSAFGGGTITWPSLPLPADANPDATASASCMGWLDRFHQFLVASRRMHRIDVIFDCDTYAITVDPNGDHGGMWGPRYANLNAFEFASLGDPTQTVLWRLQHGQVDHLHPKLVILLAGAANLSTNTPEEIAEGIKAIIQEYQKRCPEATILLHGIFPRGQYPADPIRVKINAVNKLISSLGDGKKVIYLDFGEKLLQPDGSMTKAIMSDFAFPHPSPEAYKIWAVSIQPVIDSVFPPGVTTIASGQAIAPPPERVEPQSSSSPGVFGGTVDWPSPPLAPGANSAVIPTPPMEKVNRFQRFMDDARKMPRIDLIFDGDSITAGWKTAAPAIWNSHYAKLNAFDFAVTGDTTQRLLWRLQNGEVDGLHPRLIVLLIGVNNGSDRIEQIAGGIKADVEEFRKRCPDAVILLQGILPRGELPTDPIRAKLRAVNKLISPLADGKKVLFIDWGEKILSPEGIYTRRMTGDFTHPNFPGYQIWADSIQPVIDQFFPPSATTSPTPASTP